MFFVGAFMVLANMPAQAQSAEPRLISTHGDWAAYVMTEDGNKVCYMASTPTKAQGNYTRRGEIFMLVTHRPGAPAMFLVILPVIRISRAVMRQSKWARNALRF